MREHCPSLVRPVQTIAIPTRSKAALRVALAVVCITMNTVLIPRMGVAAVCISWIAAEVLECVLSGTILMIKGKKER